MPVGFRKVCPRSLNDLRSWRSRPAGAPIFQKELAASNIFGRSLAEWHFCTHVGRTNTHKQYGRGKRLGDMWRRLRRSGHFAIDLEHAAHAGFPGKLFALLHSARLQLIARSEE